MTVQDLHVLPKVRDGWSHLYVEHCRIDREDKAVAIHDARGKVPVPCANLSLLMIGPGVSITHAAVLTLAEHGCLAAWCGEESVRFYATGMGETRSASNLLHQAKSWADPVLHMKVVRRMYELRFGGRLDPSLTLPQVRGLEGVRVRDGYSKASKEYGVPWTGRAYRRDDWGRADPVNRALSAANSCLYGICQAAIVSAGFSTALGFIHTGKMLSFVYDVADLYKTEITVPVAFKAAADGAAQIERRVRIACRERFVQARLLDRIVPDLATVLLMKPGPDKDGGVFDMDMAAPGGFWDPAAGSVEGGKDYSVVKDQGGAQDDRADS